MKWSSNKSWLLFLPAVLFLILPLYGLAAAISQSFQQQGEWTLSAYQQLFQSDRFLSAVGFSLEVAFLSSLLSLLIGLLFTRSFYPYLASHTPRLIVWMPMLFPHFVWGYMVILLLSETGVLAQVFTLLGGDDFPTLTQDSRGIGIILTYVWKEVPFVILMLLPVYATIKPEYYDLVKTLGGGAWSQFKQVEWPHLLPVMIETFLIVFAFTISAYEVPALLGTTFPEMLSVLSYNWFYGSSWDDRSLAFAAMVLLSLFILILTFIGYIYMNKKRFRMMKGKS
ncbi:sugar ABC transporter permease [Halobacillus fulvus]|nr:sugar ABC transporter permease [Halobacillus fulvus]